MRASVLFEQRTPLKVEDVELEAPRAGEVRVRMAASGVCHSCLHAADGSWTGVPVPIVLGDEGAGVVEAVGPGVQTLRVGDHVILSWAPTCGRCHYCVIGRPILCEQRRPGQGVLPEGTSRMSLGGRPVYQYGHVATYASVTVVAESSAIAIDNNIGKLESARQLGATHAIDASKEDPVAEIRRITRRGADFTFVAVGDARAVAQAADALAPGGTCVVIGVPATGATVPLDVRPLVTGERVIRGSSYGSARTREDLPRLVELYRGGRLKIDELITRRYGLDEANEAFRALAAGELARGLIVF